jgi:hypothetical protein
LTPSEVFFASLAGFTGGYVMVLFGYWLEAIFHLPRADFGLMGIRFVGGEGQVWWIAGITFHLIDSVLLGLLYAAVVRPNLGLIGLSAENLFARVGVGVGYGIFLWVVLYSLIAMPLLGVGPFGLKTRSIKLAFAGLLIHLAYGFLHGVIYLS